MGVLENINIHDGAGNTLTSTSAALDVNIKTATGPVTVVQPNGLNLHTVVDSGTVVATQPTASSLNATVRNQDGAGNNLTSTGSALDSNLKTVGGSAVQTGTGASGAGIPRVTVSNDSKIQPWDGTNSAKFDVTGETTTDITRFGGSPVLIGQTNMAHSMPVVIASDQQIAVSGVFNTQDGTANSGVLPNTLNGVLNIVNDVFVWSTLTLNFVLPLGEGLSLGGTFQLEGSIDSVTWTALTGTLLSDTPTQVTQYTTTGFLTCAARYNLAGFPWIRLRTTNPFTGTINIQQALTTALGDEVSFTTAKIVDESGQTVDLTPAAQYTEGQSPSATYFQGGFAVLPTFAATQVVDAAEAAFVLPKRSKIGNTLVVAVVLQGTGLTAANLTTQATINDIPAGTPFVSLTDTVGSVYTPLGFYDSTVTSSGQAILVYVRTITAVDNEGQLGFLALWGGPPFGTGTGEDPATVTGITILAQEYSGLVVTGDSISHLVVPPAPSGSLVSAPIAPSSGHLVYNLLSTVMPSGDLAALFVSNGAHINTSETEILSSLPVQCSTADNLPSFFWGQNGQNGLTASLDWVSVKLAIATTGTVMMGRLIGGNGDGPIQAILIDPASGGVLAAVTNDPLSPLFVQVTAPVSITTTGTNFPVQLQDGTGHAISSTLGALNVNVTNLIDPLPVTQSGTWTLTATNPSVGPTQAALPGQATVMGVVSAANGSLEIPVLDANSGLRVNIAAGSASTNPAASATGAAVPADASYTGLNIGGNLVGQTGFSLTNAKAAAVALVDSVGNQFNSINGALNVNVVDNTCASAAPTGVVVPLDANYTGFNSGGNLVGVSSTNPLPVALSSGSTPLTNTGGALNVSVVNASGTSNLAASATGSAVPADASYTGFNSGGVLTGVSASTPLPVAVNGVMDVAGFVTTSAPTPTANTFSPLSLTPSGALRVDTSGTNVTANILAGNAALTSSSGSLNVNVTGGGSFSTLSINNLGPVSGTVSVPISANTLPQTATNPIFSTITDGTKSIVSAISALGTAPIGTDVMAVNSVNLPSVAAGAALSAKFINNSGAAVSIKASAGNLYGFSLTNSTASPAFVEFFNTASAPTLGTTAVVFCVVIPASGNVTINPTTLALMNFFLGIGFAVTTAENGTATAGVTGMVFFA
jgi:hypothetical protein